MLSNKDIQYNGQVFQDKFVLTMLNHKHNGTFLELGGNDPCFISNTYLLESKYNWKGIMVEYDTSFTNSYMSKRPNSHHVFQDASTVDYASLLKELKYPNVIDYLQIDLEPGNGSTLNSLKNLDTNVFDNYKFATVTFEHDIYMSFSNNEMFKKTRDESRTIFKNRGYVQVFSDVNNDGWRDNDVRREQLIAGETVTIGDYVGQYPFEDWYVHPDLVDMNYVNSVIIMNAGKYVYNPICEKTINFGKIQY
jgi:hypothetical protein